jgi:hypothetical protein
VESGGHAVNQRRKMMKKTRFLSVAGLVLAFATAWATNEGIAAASTAAGNAITNAVAGTRSGIAKTVARSLMATSEAAATAAAGQTKSTGKKDADGGTTTPGESSKPRTNSSSSGCPSGEAWCQGHQVAPPPVPPAGCQPGQMRCHSTSMRRAAAERNRSRREAAERNAGAAGQKNEGGTK